MEYLREFLLSFRPQHIALGAPLNLVVNTLGMWFVVNRMTDVGEKVSLLRCAACALLLYLVSSAAIALLLLPIPLIFIVSVLVWLICSMIVIQGVFELTYQGGGGILFLYLIILLMIHGPIMHFMG